MPIRSPVGLPGLVMGLLIAALPAGGSADDLFQTAAACSRCHPEIYRTWRSSRHASSDAAPLIRMSLDRIPRSDPRHDQPCEHCHNPIRFFLEAGDHRAAIFALEGVTCDFCHSVEFLIQGIQGAGFPRYLVNPEVKFGPHPTAGKPGTNAHVTKFSPLHTVSLFCAGCHEYRNGHGVPVLSTYSEWDESFYRGEGIQCQFCHLPGLFDAPFLDPARKKGPIGHEMSGGHSRELLARALPIRATLTTEGRESRVTIQVKNDFAGHKAPSGIPSNRLRLETTVYGEDRSVLGRGEEIFERVLGDGSGKPLRLPEQYFPAAKEVLKDNRIAPKEVRKVIHRFPLEGNAPATAEVALLYETFIPGLAPGLESSSIAVLRIVVPVATGPSRALIALAVAAAAILIVAAALALRRHRR